MTSGSVADLHPPPIRQDELGQESAVGVLPDFRLDGEPPGLEARSLEDLHFDGSHEEIPLGLGVLPGRIRELPGEGIDEIGEPLDVGGRQRHRRRHWAR